MANKIGNIVRNGVIYGSGDSSDIAFDPTVKNVLDATTVNVQDAIDELSTDIKDSLYISADSKNLKFGKDGDGNYGYYKGDGTFSPFKSGFSDLLYVAPEYDTSVTYMVDDIVLNENVLYRCTATTTGTFDSAKWERIYLTDIAQEEVVQSNENLLDNAWFNVNQRNTTSVTNDYGVDRWSGTYTVSNSNLVMTTSDPDYLLQMLESSLKNELNGKQVTASIMYNDNSIEYGTVTYDSNPSNWITVISTSKMALYIAPNTYSTGDIRLTCVSGCTIKAVKLELGDKSTLYLDSAPDVKWETVKCQLSTADANDTYANMIIIKSLLKWSTIKYLTMSSSSASYDSSTKTIDFTTTSASNNGLQAYFTIDVTSISTITIYYSLTLYATYSGQAIGVCTSVPSTAGTLPTYLKSTALASGTNKTATLDVSSYTGEVYIDINLTASSGKITNIIFG